MTKERGPKTQVAVSGATTNGGIDRRRFVGLVTAGAAAGWLVDDVPGAWAATIAAPSVSQVVPGYLRESWRVAEDDGVLASLSDFSTPLYDTLRPMIPETTPLEFLSSVDPGEIPRGFKSGRVRIWIHGLIPPGSAVLANGLKAIHLGAEISGWTEEMPVRTYVWGLCEEPVENLSSATAFEVSMTEKTMLRLVTSFEPGEKKGFGGGNLESSLSSPGLIAECTTDFTLVDRRNAPRLRPGVYCMPLNDSAQWAFPLVANRDWLVPDELPYLLFSIQSLD